MGVVGRVLGRIRARVDHLLCVPTPRNRLITNKHFDNVILLVIAVNSILFGCLDFSVIDAEGEPIVRHRATRSPPTHRALPCASTTFHPLTSLNACNTCTT